MENKDKRPSGRIPKIFYKIKNNIVHSGLHIKYNTHIRLPFYCSYGYNIVLGDKVFMNHNVSLLDHGEITLGDNVMIAPNVILTTVTHPKDANVRKTGEVIVKPIHLGNDVWVGANSIILPGVTIGNNTIIGAGSVVTKSFGNNLVIAGNPAAIIEDNNKKIERIDE